MENLYDIIGVSPSVSDEELDSAYKKLREKYGEERFQNGPAGEEAADKLEKLERAYSEIKRARSEYKSYGQDSEQAYAAIEEVLKNGDINKAQEMLDNLTPRTAEWHYLQSIVFYKKNWFLESKKQLEFALSLDPQNMKYKNSLEKLNKILASTAVPPEQMRTTSAPAGNGYTAPAGNRSGGNTRVDIREKRRLLHSNRRSCRRSVHDYFRQIFLCSSVCGFFRAVYNRQSVCRQKQIVCALQMAYKIRRSGNRARAFGIAHLFVFFGELGALHVARMVFVGVFACAASGACAV